MNNYKIKVNSKNESKEVQDLFESLGYEKGACSLGSYPAVIVTTQDWATGSYCSTRALGLDIPAHDNYTEITLAELRDKVVLKRNDRADANVEEENCLYDLYLTRSGDLYFYHCGKNKWILSNISGDESYYKSLKPIEKTMKEFLLKDKSGTWHYNNSSMDSCPAHVDKVEIPEGAEFAVLNGDNEINFYTGIGLEKNHFISDAVVWQRPTQPEALPFIDDEPQSLNDQYAEIEQVRQMEIHGNVEAEPDFNFGAAHSKGGVDSTLAERQSQCGCYEDVAQVTQQILSALRIGNYDKLPAPMKESLHMIASKMARIVNGDPKYLDNWHDIGGYAKLIEKLIKGE